MQKELGGERGSCTERRGVVISMTGDVGGTEGNKELFFSFFSFFISYIHC